MKVKIFEVGPRDGLQNQSKVMSVEQRIKFVQMLFDAGHRNIEVGAFVNPKKIPQMAESFEVVRGLAALEQKNKTLKLWTLVPNDMGFKNAVEAGSKNIAVFTAASETFNKRNTNVSIEESMSRFKLFVPAARKMKMGLRGYISTCFGCPYEGKISSRKVIEVAEKLLILGIQEISIGDTIGVATPSEVKNLVKQLSKSISLKKLALHFHDTRGTALANILSGLNAGIRIFDSSAGGLGGCPYAPGAAGNVATDDLLYMLDGMGIKTGINLDLHLKCSLFIQDCLGEKLPSRVLQAGQPHLFS